MRSRLLTLLLLLVPFAAQAGEPFDIPPAGVLHPKKSVASLYAPDLTSGAPLKTDIAVDAAPAVPAAAAIVPLPKPAPKAARAMRPASRSYVRQARRPPASLPPATRPVAYAPPAEPAPGAATPQPVAEQSGGSFFGNLFGAPRSPSGKRGLFTSAAETPAPQPQPSPYRQPMPQQPSQLY